MCSGRLCVVSVFPRSALMDLIIDLHTATSARVRLAGRLSAPFMTTFGVRQGCVLAPALFCRAMDFIMEHVSRIESASKSANIRSRTSIMLTTSSCSLTRRKASAPLSQQWTTKLPSSVSASRTKTKIQNLGSGSTPLPVTEEVTVDPVVVS